MPRGKRAQDNVGDIDGLKSALEGEQVDVNAIVAKGLADYKHLLDKPNDALTDGDVKKATIAGKVIGSATALMRAIPSLAGKASGVVPTAALIRGKPTGMVGAGIVDNRESDFYRMVRPGLVDDDE